MGRQSRPNATGFLDQDCGYLIPLDRPRELPISFPGGGVIRPPAGSAVRGARAGPRTVDRQTGGRSPLAASKENFQWPPLRPQ
ncbi:hypothetical protein CFP75_02395 [Amycolatopsis alba DSM 44262]|uniref:Uncharacterized protein n=1 Tax=Amycolatopsis alba DSM 44262 TaxID=1125972 RepID=A0A229S857_AMYAL|nr:hypothetical protein CFP75_02395 [Amycolatopsis alba DSM 44262]